MSIISQHRIETEQRTRRRTPGDILQSHSICHIFTLVNGGATPPRMPMTKLPMTANNGPSSLLVTMLMQLEKP